MTCGYTKGVDGINSTRFIATPRGWATRFRTSPRPPQAGWRSLTIMRIEIADGTTPAQRCPRSGQPPATVSRALRRNCRGSGRFAITVRTHRARVAASAATH